MPFEVMNQRGVSTLSHFYDDISFPPEKNPGLRKQKSIHERYPQGKSEITASPGSILNASSPRGMNAKTGLPMSQTGLSSEGTGSTRFGGKEGIADVLKDSKELLNYHPRSWTDVRMQPTSSSYGFIGNKIVANAASRESSLFSSSLSDMFTQKLRLMGNDVFRDQSVSVGSLPEEEPYKSLQEIEADTIGNLLPDEDDLFSGVADELGSNVHAKANDDFEDFDLFSSGGGMELEGDEHLVSGKRASGLEGDLGYFGGSKGKIPLGDQSSRTLFVRNINSNVDDSELKTLFEQYGDIRTMYTACKPRGFVMISYYDIRAAQNAMKALQHKSLRSRKLDIHYSIPKGNAPEKDIGHGGVMISGLDSSVSNEELKHIFALYGEIKEIYESPEVNHVKFIEFYDVRAAEASLGASNRICIPGKQIKLEPGHPRNAILMQQSQKGQEEPDFVHNLSDNLLRQNATSSGAAISGGSLESGYNQGFQSAKRIPLNGFVDNALYPVGSSIPKMARGASGGKVSGVYESANVVDAMKLGSITRFHPHSLPEFHDGLASGSPYNFSNPISNVAASIGTGSTELSDSRHIQGIGSPGNLAEFNAVGNGSRPPQGLYHMWNNSNLHQQPPSNAMLWHKTPPSFINGAGAPGVPQMPGFPRTPPHVLRSSQIDHHVGSAPVVTASPWERQPSYLGESPEASSFRMGSLGSTGFHGSWQMHPPDLSSRNMFSHVGGNSTELSSSAGQGSPKLSHFFPGRLPMNSMLKFDSANERMRSLYHRRSEANTNSADKKQYELDLGRILRGEDNRTTLMIKNIPNKYTSKMLLAAIDEQCRGTYDFLYLPIDFKNKCNVGYAFINMIDPGQIIQFHQAFNGKKWEKFNSEKVAVLAYARIQGKAALIAHFQNSSLMNEDKRCRPILFHTDGPNAGDPEPFPLGNNIRTRPGKSRTSANDENRNQGSSSAAAGGDESANGVESSLSSSKT
ncbi:protein MEI2-like 1 isoform X2 [Arachis stenosperma]|nr:protein MEI2-like 1 isoform X2 [Arachis stenosperma]